MFTASAGAKTAADKVRKDNLARVRAAE
jgi:hypothetical protein